MNSFVLKFLVDVTLKLLDAIKQTDRDQCLGQSEKRKHSLKLKKSNIFKRNNVYISDHKRAEIIIQFIT